MGVYRFTRAYIFIYSSVTFGDEAHGDEMEENFMIATATGAICIVWNTVSVGNDSLIVQIWRLTKGLVGN